MKSHYLAAIGMILLCDVPPLKAETTAPETVDQSTAPIKVGEKMETLTLADGKEYKKVTVLKVLPDELSIMHEGGGARIHMEKLSEEIKERCNFVSEEEAEKLRAARRKSQIAYNKRANEAMKQKRANEARAVQESKRTLEGRWHTTGEFNPRFKELLSKAKAEAGGLVIKGGGSIRGAHYTKGKYKGKNKEGLIEMVKGEYRRKYSSKQYYVRYFVPDSKEGGGGGGNKMADVRVIQAEIEAIQKELESGVKGEGTVTDPLNGSFSFEMQLTKADRAIRNARLQQLKIQLASLTNGSR